MFELNNFMVAGKFFLIIAGELIVIFVVVAFIVGLLLEYITPAKIKHYFEGRLLWVQYLLGAAFGAITPFCSCSTVPVLTGLLRGGVPFGPAMAFLFSSPVLNPIIIALLLSLIGVQATLVYSVVTFSGTILAAALLSRLGFVREVKPLAAFQSGSCCDADASADSTENGICCSGDGAEMAQGASCSIAPAGSSVGGSCCGDGDADAQQAATLGCGPSADATTEPTDNSFKARTRRAMVSAVGTFKGVFWYLMLGAGIGAFIYGFFPAELVARLAGPGNRWSIPTAAALGVPMYIRAETVIPIGAALIGKGMGLGTVLALVVAGAGAGIPEIIILSSIFKRRLVAAFILCVFIVAIATGYIVDWLGIVPLIGKA